MPRLLWLKKNCALATHQDTALSSFSCFLTTTDLRMVVGQEHVSKRASDGSFMFISEEIKQESTPFN